MLFASKVMKHTPMTPEELHALSVKDHASLADLRQCLAEIEHLKLLIQSLAHDLLELDKSIATAPKRPYGAIKVNLQYVGRGTPSPLDQDNE